MDHFYTLILLLLIAVIDISILFPVVKETFVSYYVAQPTKCFSCEKEIARRYGLKYSDLGQPTKCFDCESQMGNNPLKAN